MLYVCFKTSDVLMPNSLLVHTLQNNHYNKPDVALFDFTSIHQTEHAAKAIKKDGKVLYLCLVGDSLLEVHVE